MIQQFSTDQIRTLLTETNRRLELMKKMDKGFHYIFKVEDINICDTWPKIYEEIKPKTLSVAPKINISASDSANLAFHFDFIDLFFKYNRLVQSEGKPDQIENGQEDTIYNGLVASFFQEYDKMIDYKIVDELLDEESRVIGHGRDAETLFNKAFR